MPRAAIRPGRSGRSSRVWNAPGSQPCQPQEAGGRGREGAVHPASITLLSRCGVASDTSKLPAACDQMLASNAAT